MPTTCHVLIVDDSPTMRRMIRAALQGLPEVEFLEASNGLEAIERLALSPVTLATVDLNMPDMHGLELLQFVREHPRYRELPVLVLTTRGDHSSRAAVERIGAAAYLTKPFSADALASQASRLLAAGQIRAAEGPRT